MSISLATHRAIESVVARAIDGGQYDYADDLLSALRMEHAMTCGFNRPADLDAPLRYLCTCGTLPSDEDEARCPFTHPRRGRCARENHGSGGHRWADEATAANRDSGATA